MSAIYQVGVRIYGNSSSYLGAVNQTIAGTRRLGQGFQTAANQGALLDKQGKAIATTFRYALAGSIIFGVTAAISKLQNFETQLGTIDALASKLNKQGKFAGLGNQLDDVGSKAIEMSNKWGVAVDNVLSYQTRFFSTFQRGSKTIKDYINQSVQFADVITQLSTALGTEAGDPNALAGGIAGLVNATPGGKQNPGAMAARYADLIAKYVQQTPNVTGTDIASAAGRLASVYNIANVTPEQLFAIYGQAAKVGGSPSIVTRGVQQLLGMSLLHPKTPANKQAYLNAGLPTDPTQLRNMGGQAVLEALMRSVTPAGGFALSKKQLQGVNKATTRQQLQDMALPGLDVTALFNMFGRIQSVQQFINILSQDGVKGLRNFLSGLQDATKEHTHTLMAEKARSRQEITIFKNATGNLSLSLVRGLNPVFGVLNKFVVPLSSFAAAHRSTVVGAEIGGATAIAANRILPKFSFFKGLSVKWRQEAQAAEDIGNKLPFAKRLFRRGVGALTGINRLQQQAAGAAILAEETPNVVAGTAADGSRANPFWVIISPYSWQFGYGGMSQPTKSTTEQKVFDDVKKVAKGGFWGGLAAKASGVGLDSALTVGGAATVLGSLPFLLKGDSGSHTMRYGAGARHFFIDPKKGIDTYGMTKPQMGALFAAVNAAKIGLPGTTVTFQGNAKADLTIRLVDKNGNQILVTEKKGVPIAVTKDQAPMKQGRTGVNKGR